MNPAKDTERIIFFISKTTILSEFINICEANKKSKDNAITLIIFDNSSLKEVLLKKDELKNSIGKKRIKSDKKNTINAQNKPSPDQLAKELLESFTEIKRYAEKPRSSVPKV